jgi:hypothetical protein
VQNVQSSFNLMSIVWLKAIACTLTNRKMICGNTWDFLWCRLIISTITKYGLSFFVSVVLSNRHQKYYFVLVA